MSNQLKLNIISAVICVMMALITHHYISIALAVFSLVLLWLQWAMND